MPDTRIKVSQFQRKSSLFSVERLFDDVRSALPPAIDVAVIFNRFQSIGFWRRLFDVIRAAHHQGHVNHVAGDVHYLTYLLDSRRTVLTILDCGSLERLCGVKRWVFWLLWYWLPEKRSAAITVISEATKYQLLRYLHCDPCKIHVIHCPVSSEFEPSPKPFNSDYPRILQVGTSENKNIPRIAEALEGLSCCFVIVGPLSELQERSLLQHHISYENYVGLTREELLSQYRLSDMVIFASLYEGFGLPIVEANAVGRVVITSQILSMPEVGADAALYVDPHDSRSIRQAVEHLIFDSECRNRLIANGYANVKRFRLPKIAADYARLYRHVFALNHPV
jgi:glycosyltransferase involved in cell wall biosynthesis